MFNNDKIREQILFCPHLPEHHYRCGSLLRLLASLGPTLTAGSTSDCSCSDVLATPLYASSALFNFVKTMISTFSFAFMLAALSWTTGDAQAQPSSSRDRSSSRSNHLAPALYHQRKTAKSNAFTLRLHLLLWQLPFPLAPHEACPSHPNRAVIAAHLCREGGIGADLNEPVVLMISASVFKINNNMFWILWSRNDFVDNEK